MPSVPSVRSTSSESVGFFLRAFGFDISRTKATPPAGLQSPSSWGSDWGRGWWPVVRESFAGAWQRNITVDRALADTFHADFACKTLIARDIAKLRVKLMEQNEKSGIWSETKNAAYDPVLRKPNRFQTRNQFWENWLLSKLSRGNAYVLKQRDNRGGEARGNVTALFVLDPNRCRPLVAPDGAVFYELNTDNLVGLDEKTITVPTSEIIHDRFNCLHHPLVGLPPVYASGLAAIQGLNIQTHSTKLFANRAAPGGILTAPGPISDDNAKRLKEYWEENFTGDKVGRVAVLGDGLKFEKLALTAVEGQLIEQLKWTAEVVCSTYHVPPYKIGVGQLPSYNNVQALNVEYYSQCLQSLIEDAESCLDEGLGIGYGTGLGVEFDIDNLLRMDSVTQMDVLTKAAGILEIDEMRAALGRRPTAGGNAVYLQQQNYSLPALAKRDAKENPFASSSTAPPAPGGSSESDSADNDNSPEALAASEQSARWITREFFADVAA